MALTGLVIIFLTFFAGALIVQKLPTGADHHHLAESQKVPFLGGSKPNTHAWQRYHIRYYSMTLLFIAFEMEMMFMYPWAVVYVTEGVKALAEMGMFLSILTVGILYGWREGIFRWQ
ncbi:NADH dehydrogenase I subunit A [Salinisphaera dokdonensis CL-ES53]|uniref:NADH-quinone oxidoreductase subunit n=1 Tax=Salinisphaera dokdonensis CL-ES53 TaxID=1304272 RepID=A0ABV2B4U7_9GAMM